MSMLAAPAPAVSAPAPAQDYGFPPFFPTTAAAAADASLMAPGYYNPEYLGGCSDFYGGSGTLPMEVNSWMAALPSPDLTPNFSPDCFPLMNQPQDVNTYTAPFDARFNTSGSFGDAASSLPQMPSNTNIQSSFSQSNDDLPQPQPIKTQSSPPRSSSSRSPSPLTRRTRRSRSPPTPVLPEDTRARAAHNVVEKHYRRRLNAQFAALLQALPSQLHPDGGSDDAAAAGKKVRKAEVLELARQYIEALETSGKALRREREVLAGRLEWMQERTGIR